MNDSQNDSKLNTEHSTESNEPKSEVEPHPEPNVSSNQDQKRKSHGCLVWIIVIIIIAVLVSCFGADNDEEYADLVERSVIKAYTGQDMTRQERQAAEGYFDWEEEYGVHPYDW